MANGFGNIEHIIVLMLENRSFDHMLGFLKAQNSRIDGLIGNEEIPQNPGDSASPNVGVSAASDWDDYVVSPDPGHELEDVNLQLFGTSTPGPGVTPKNNGFVLSYARVCRSATDPDFDKGQTIMRCYMPERDLPVLSALALNFTLCDRWHASVPSSTWPNRFFVHAATSKGDHATLSLKPEIIEQSLRFYDMTTIYHRLEESRYSWRIYHHGFPQASAIASLWQYIDDNFRLFDVFLEDVASGRLPNYSFIEPSYMAHSFLGQSGSDQHPAHDVRNGERLIANVYNAIRASDEVWKKSLLVILYDEHGGFYDHVPPPAATPPDDVSANSEDFKFDRLGVRVPAVLVSPWLPASVDNWLYDHTSLLKTVEKRFGLPPLTGRDGDSRTRTFDHNFLAALRPDEEMPKKLLPIPVDKVIPATFRMEPTEHQKNLQLLAAFHTERSGSSYRVVS